VAAMKALDVRDLYWDYMRPRAPAQKRLFHLVYDRAEHAGGPGHDSRHHIKWQTARFAEDLKRLTQLFIDDCAAAYKLSATYALGRAEIEESKA